MDDTKELLDFNEVYHYRDKNLNFMGSILCPLKKKTKSELSDILDRIEKESGKKYNCYIADGHGSITDEYSDYWQIESIDEFPDIIVSKGFDELYRNKLYDNLISKGYFERVKIKNMPEQYKNSDLMDQSYTMFGAFLDVFIIDKSAIGELPEPRSWEDLLNPIYRNKIVISEKSKEVSIPLLLHYHKNIGEQGIVKLAENTLKLIPGKQLPEAIEDEANKEVAIYITSYSSAKSLETENIKVVVPTEGAVVLPFAMLVKKDKIDELDFLTDYIVDNYADGLSNLGSISLSQESEVKNLNWIGWDYVKEKDITELNKKLQDLFIENL